MPSAWKLQRIPTADRHKGRQRPWKNALIRIWAAFSPDVRLSLQEGWGGGEKGFKLIFTTRKELVIHTIWAATSSEPPRLPPVGARLGPSLPSQLPSLFHPCFPPCTQHAVNPSCLPRTPSTCALFYQEQNKLQLLLSHQLSFIIPTPPLRPGYLLPLPSYSHMWFLFKRDGSTGRKGGGGKKKRRNGAVY